MASVRIRSFNARRAEMFGYKPGAAEHLILLRSWVHSHTELQFSERYDSISFSATMAEGVNGCRFKHIGYSHPEYWDTIIIHLTDAEEDTVFAAAKKIDGQPYDIIGLMSFASKFDVIKPRSGYWWCTEAVLHCLFVVERLKNIIPLIPDHAHPSMCDMILRMFFRNEVEINQTQILRMIKSKGVSQCAK